MIRSFLACVLLSGAPLVLEAQETRLLQEPIGPRRMAEWSVGPANAPAWVPIDFPRVSTGLATGASLALPGTGQLLLGQGRWALYAGLELAGWLFHLDRRRDGHHLRNQYFELAWMVARSGGPQSRQEGDWEYYERLGSWMRSGAFDADPVRAGVQPEGDPDSFNGATWELARDIFLPVDAGEGHPAYAKALDFYEQRAYPPELLWDWTGNEASLQEYRDLISRSDEALRTATVVLGAVVANHLLSGVDAFVSSHTPAAPSISASMGLRSLLPAPVVEWVVEIRP